MKIKALLILLIVACISGCGNNDETFTGTDACGNGTNETVDDKRCLFTVSTLTESFNGSGGLTVGPDDFIYVGDYGDFLNNANGTTVSRINPQTGAIEVFAEGLEGASGNTFSPDGNLIQVNIQGNSVSQISPEGVIMTLFDKGFTAPVGIEFDGEGNLYVCNCGSNTIRKISSDSTSITFSDDVRLACPNGLAIDDNDNLYVSNFSDPNVIKISPDGNAETFASIPGGGNAHIAFGNDVLFVVARAGGRVYEITLDGVVSVIAGTGEDGNDDGDGQDASFFVPNGIDVSNDGQTIYVTSRVVDDGLPLNPVLVRTIRSK